MMNWRNIAKNCRDNRLFLGRKVSKKVYFIQDATFGSRLDIHEYHSACSFIMTSFVGLFCSNDFNILRRNGFGKPYIVAGMPDFITIIP